METKSGSKFVHLALSLTSPGVRRLELVVICSFEKSKRNDTIWEFVLIIQTFSVGVEKNDTYLESNGFEFYFAIF